MIDLSNQGQKEAFVTGLLMNGGAIAGDSANPGPKSMYTQIYRKNPKVVFIGPSRNVRSEITRIVEYYYNIRIFMYSTDSSIFPVYIKDILIDKVSMKSQGILCSNFIINTAMDNERLIEVIMEDYPNQPVFRDKYGYDNIPILKQMAYTKSGPLWGDMAYRNIRVSGVSENYYSFIQDTTGALFLYLDNLPSATISVYISLVPVDSTISVRSLLYLDNIFNPASGDMGSLGGIPGKAHTFVATFELIKGQSQRILTYIAR